MGNLRCIVIINVLGVVADSGKFYVAQQYLLIQNCIVIVNVLGVVSGSGKYTLSYHCKCIRRSFWKRKEHAVLALLPYQVWFLVTYQELFLEVESIRCVIMLTCQEEFMVVERIRCIVMSGNGMLKLCCRCYRISSGFWQLNNYVQWYLIWKVQVVYWRC